MQWGNYPLPMPLHISALPPPPIGHVLPLCLTMQKPLNKAIIIPTSPETPTPLTAYPPPPRPPPASHSSLNWRVFIVPRVRLGRAVRMGSTDDARGRKVLKLLFPCKYTSGFQAFRPYQIPAHYYTDFGGLQHL